MLPIIATIGTGLAWFATTAGQLIFWGAGICVGFWVGKKLTNTWDKYGHTQLAKFFMKKEGITPGMSEEEQAASTLRAATA